MQNIFYGFGVEQGTKRKCSLILSVDICPFVFTTLTLISAYVHNKKCEIYDRIEFLNLNFNY